jgi:beta-lactamase class A
MLLPWPPEQRDTLHSSVKRQLPTRTHSALIAVVVLVTALISSSCSTPQTPAAATDGGVKISTNTPPGLRAQQTLDMINSDAPVELPAVDALSAPKVGKIVLPLIDNIWWDRPFTVSAVDYYVDRVTLHMLNSYGAEQVVDLHTDVAGLIDRFDTRVDPPKINSWADVDAELAKSHAQYSYQVAKVNDGRCERVAGINTAESLPTASIFKLYVLYAIADAVKAGTLSWDDELTVTKRAKAVEFAGFEEAPLGSKLSVRAAANQMIAKSSNTATELLIDRIGTAAVERALLAAGHHDPQSMTPFPTMYELFSIGWGEPDRRQQWKDAVATGSPQARAQLLAQASAEPYKPDPQRSRTPASAFGVEWYATAEDICRVHAALQASAIGVNAPIKEILSQVSGIDLDPKQWPYIGAKGGNLPGDLTYSWYAVDPRGQAWVISFQMSWPKFVGLSAWGWLRSIATQVFAIAGRLS